MIVQVTEKEQMVLGELEKVLSEMDQAAILSPCSGLVSYRGYYDEVCINTSHDKEMSVADLLSEVREALGGKVYVGYKGGEFVYQELTPVWIADYDMTGSRLLEIDRNHDFVVVHDCF